MNSLATLLTKFPHYIRKIIELGSQKSCVVIKQRLYQKYVEYRLRTRARAGTAHHTWPMIARQLQLTESFEQWWQEQKTRELSFLTILYNECEHKDIIAQANAYVAQTFDLLGSGVVIFDRMLWHEDFRLKQQLYAHPEYAARCVSKDGIDYTFDQYAFYQDISITPGATKQLSKDIKIPWELSRFAHLLVLGQAYQVTSDETYAIAFAQQVADWLDYNPYLLGVNWVCPMDVGIRALNWVVAYHYFKDSPSIAMTFWQRFTCSLYDHFIYLEQHWEIYDGITSNHYLSDLIGYFYLGYFFDHQSKAAWCYEQLLHEFEKQVFDEGTDYESTTSYHGLVTEIFYHAFLMARYCGFSVSSHATQKLSRMLMFCAQTKDLYIGDNDSGKILLYGLPASILPSIGPGLWHYPEFGLSIYNHQEWKISLRHHAYQWRQPTAHLHNDAASVTLSYQAIPLVVDPGSYVYTPSVYWRNYFRSVEVHNTFWLEGHEPAPFDDRLFALAMAEGGVQPKELATAHNLYKRFGVQAVRKLTPQSHGLIITDCWQALDELSKSLPATRWNFTLEPYVNPIKKEDSILLCVQGQSLIELSSPSLTFEVHDSWVCPEYGVKVATKQLRARKRTVVNESVTILFNVVTD
jgi:hypothetical protein